MQDRADESSAREITSDLTLQVDLDLIEDPISKLIMRNPVLASDGHLYELYELYNWIKSDHKTSPLTRENLTFVIIHKGLKAALDLTYGEDPDRYSNEYYISSEEDNNPIKTYCDFLASHLKVLETPKRYIPTLTHHHHYHRSHYNEQDKTQMVFIAAIYGGLTFAMASLYQYASVFFLQPEAQINEYMPYLAAMGVGGTELVMRLVTNDQYGSIRLLHSIFTSDFIMQKASTCLEFFTSRANYYSTFFRRENTHDLPAIEDRTERHFRPN